MVRSLAASASLLAVAAITAPARPATALDWGLEVSPGVGVPLGTFIDGVPFAGSSPQVGDAAAMFDLTSLSGATLGLALLLDQWEIRYTTHVLPFDRLVMTHLMIKRYTDQAFFPIESFRKAIGTSPPLLPPDQPTTWDARGLQPAVIHALTAGYRFRLLDGSIRPYVPVALGFALGQIKGNPPAPGVTVQIGAGVEWWVHPRFAIGTSIRYHWVAVRNPKTIDTSVTQLGMQSILADDSVFEGALESVHLLSFSANLTIRL